MDFVRSLLVLAAPAEFAAARAAFALSASPPLWSPINARPGVDIVQSGVGKANAAACVAWCLARERYQRVVSVGIAGALPGSGLALGDVVVASASTYADEGVATPDGFLDMASLGFGPGANPLGPSIGLGMSVNCDHRPAIAGARSGVIATVSTCSGSDGLAAEVTRRTGAIAEAMEGAAVGFTATRLGSGFGELRVISNSTGSRASQRWDLQGALQRLAGVIQSPDV